MSIAKSKAYIFLTLAALVFAGCEDGMIRDYRGDLSKLGTPSDSAEKEAKFVEARRGDTIRIIAARVGQDADALAAYNSIDADRALQAGDLIALLPKGADGSEAALKKLPDGGIEPAPKPQTKDTTQAENKFITRIRHKVKQGETIYSIAQMYNISVQAISEWNTLNADLSLRAGDQLIIPVRADPAAGVSAGASTTDSASAPQNPIPEEEEGFRIQKPLNGDIITKFEKGKTEGIDIKPRANRSVYAAADGQVATITRDTNGIAIIILRHEDNMLTIYEYVEDIIVAKDDKVTRGQKIADIKASNSAYLHFELRKGFEPVNPVEYFRK